MSSKPGTTAIEELIAYLFDGQASSLAAAMSGWLADSRRFTNFATTFRDKIRKKLRTAQDEERLQDLRLELETAFRLLQEKTLSVDYEPQYGKVRAPDFAVTFTTSMTFMVEVTRLRGANIAEEENPSLVVERLLDAVCSKLGQLLPQSSNVLIVGVDSPCPTQSDVQMVMLRLRQRAERNEAILLGRYRFRDRADFFRQYQRLSEIIVRPARRDATTAITSWVNSQAKYPLPGKVRTALYRSQESAHERER